MSSTTGEPPAVGMPTAANRANLVSCCEANHKAKAKEGAPMGLVPYSAAAAPKGATNSGDCAKASAIMPRCAICRRLQWLSGACRAMQLARRGSRLFGVEAKRHG